MSQDGDSGSDSCGSRYFSEDGAETGGEVAGERLDNFVFTRDKQVPDPVELDESEEEDAPAASGPKRKKRVKKSKGKSSGKDWKHHVVRQEEGEGFERDRTTFPNAQGVAELPPWFCARARNGGVNLSPREYFGMTFTAEMRDRVVHHTNLYVTQYWLRERPADLKEDGYWPPLWVRNFKPLTAAVFDKWLGFLILMGVSHNGRERRFWSEHPLFHRPIVGKTMSRNRWLDIKRALHCQDDAAEPPVNEYDPTKISILMQMFLSQSRAIYNPGENCSIDEMMLAFKGISSMKFTRQAKPTRDGLKIFAICESSTGYVFGAYLDRRKGETVEEMVLRLVHHGKGSWRTVYMDDYFTSVCTFKKMLDVQTYGCGTTRANRGLPDEFEKKEVKGTMKSLLPGTCRWKHGDENFLAALWIDSGPCVGLSTRHDGTPTKVLRRSTPNPEPRAPNP